MGTKCGGTYTERRSLRKGSYPRSVAFGPDDARESPATSSLRDHPLVRAMRFRVFPEMLPATARLDAPAWSSAWRALRAAGLAVTAVLVLTACSHSAGTAPAPASSSSILPRTVPMFPTGSPVPSGPPSVVSVLVAPAPTGPVTAAQLGSPEAAASTWLSRWCAYDWRSPLGTRENLAHPVMTERGWLNFDPLTSPASAKAWAAIVAARQSAVCSAPVALVSPEAPRSATGAYVIVTANRVITPEGGTPVVEQVRQTRQVLFGEGRWLVDIAADAG